MLSHALVIAMKSMLNEAIEGISTSNVQSRICSPYDTHIKLLQASFLYVVYIDTVCYETSLAIISVLCVE